MDLVISHLADALAEYDSNPDPSASSIELFPRIIELCDDAPMTTCTVSDTTHSKSGTTTDPMHRSKRKTKCPICDDELLAKTLPRHLRTVHPNTESKPTCLICGLDFKREDILKRHQREQHGDGGNTIRCDLCGTLVKVRSLREHRQSQKCRDVEVSSEHSPTTEVGHEDLVINRVWQPHATLLVDPLVIAACLHRLALLVRLSRESRYWPSETYRTLSSKVGAGSEDGISQLDATVIHTDFQLPSWDFANLWHLRQMALGQTREVLERHIHHKSTALVPNNSFDEGIIQVSLLKSADEFIFGDDSTEYSSHFKGFSSLWNTTRPTEQFIPRFQGLLDHTWRVEKMEIKYDFDMVFSVCRPCEIPVDLDPRFDREHEIYLKYVSSLRRNLEAHEFEILFTPGVQGVWRSPRPQMAYEARAKGIARQNTSMQKTFMQATDCGFQKSHR